MSSTPFDEDKPHMFPEQQKIWDRIGKCPKCGELAKQYHVFIGGSGHAKQCVQCEQCGYDGGACG